ncbi:HNH endonuclease [Nocardioides sp. YIM 152588]|uniref:HNH endonuclease signature motif containing protein n=1 Tax=Nocardioides sp. YIM 152588 TaxID=3158259 RepID=UPI0032E44895
MRTCRRCGADLTKPSQKVFCGTECHQAFARAERVAAWLRTGAASTSSLPGHYIREHIAGEQDGRCALCGITAEWQARPLVFILDHVDGDSTNNARDNLRLVCPNCDSQLPTFKARNRGNGRHMRRARYAAGDSY